MQLQCNSYNPPIYDFNISSFSENPWLKPAPYQGASNPIPAAVGFGHSPDALFGHSVVDEQRRACVGQRHLDARLVGIVGRPVQGGDFGVGNAVEQHELRHVAGAQGQALSPPIPEGKGGQQYFRNLHRTDAMNYQLSIFRLFPTDYTDFTD